MNVSQQQAIVAKVTWRLIPLVFLCYVIAYVDRINVGFAKLQLREALEVDETVFSSVYGFGAGLFFVGYFLFEVPGNLILERLGARRWIALIVVLWGAISAAMMLVRSPAAFYLMRFLLGAAQAGFFPGIVLYFTYWYVAKERARTVALFATGGLVAGLIGSPVSGAILEYSQGVAGLAAWQWLFVIEGVPSILLGLVVLALLPDGPHRVRWLSPEERNWLQAELDRDRRQAALQGRHRLRDAFTSGRVWFLCLLYFLIAFGGYGYEFWLPTIVKRLSGRGTLTVGLISAIPYLAAIVIMVLVARHSDQTGERRWHVALAAMTSVAGFVLSACLEEPLLAMAALTLAFVGLKSTLGPFWAQATSFLSGTAAAGGIAWINSVGNLGGFVGPTVVGRIEDATGSNVAALLILGSAMLAMGLLAAMGMRSSGIMQT